MKDTNVLIERVYKGCILFIGLLGIMIHLIGSERVVQTLSYYTTQSNIFAVVMVAWFLIQKVVLGRSPTRLMMTLKGMATVGIFVTLLVYHIVLRPVILSMDTAYQVGGINDLMVHYITPLFMIIDWMVFDREISSLKMPFIWLILPFYYIGYIMIYNGLGGWFYFEDTINKVPYFFLDVQNYGIGNVLLWSFGVLVVYLVAGYVLIFVQFKIRSIGTYFNKPSS